MNKENSRPAIPAGLERMILEASPDGVVIVDGNNADLPLLWANRGFETLSGYMGQELAGGSLRVLQGGDRDQPGLAELRDAIGRGSRCTVVLRNYRPDGTLWWNRLSVVPLKNSQGEVWWAGFVRDVTAQREMEIMLGRSADELDAAKRRLDEVDPLDRLTGLQSERSFEVSLELAWFACAREGRHLVLFLFAPDAFDVYLDTFGRVAADSCVRMLARAVGTAFRRSTDVTARIGDAEFAALAVGMERSLVDAHARRVCDRVRALAIHNPRAPLTRNLTLSAAAVMALPTRSPDWRSLLDKARLLLADTQAIGTEQVRVAD